MGLNAEQQRAVDSNSDRILCLAGAGGGKTKTLISRINRLVNSGVNPTSILVLTFTNAAAAEMKSRYEAENDTTVTPEFRTFHAFCYSLLCKDSAIRSALGYTTTPSIISEEKERSIEERARVQCKITISKEKLKHRDNLTREEQRQAELYDKAVTRLMLMENAITFDRLNNLVSELFVSNHPATMPYKFQYKHICVDEFQDTDKVQVGFLNSFSDVNFYFTGDTLQNLYSFRGTSNDYIKALANSDGWEVIKLFTNYRSTNQICKYANDFSIKYADPVYRVEMQGTRDGEKVHKRFVDPPIGFSVINNKSIADVVAEYSKLDGTSAILCRTNKEVSAVISYLNANGVAYTSKHESKLHQMVSCALSDSTTVNYLASCLSDDKYGEYIRLSAQMKSPDLRWFLDTYGNIPQIKSEYDTIDKLRKISVMPGDVEFKMAAVSQTFNLTEMEFPEEDYFGDDFLTYLSSLVANVKSNGIYVGTIHSVKGLEYDNVFVMNVGSYNFKLNNEDEKNLFYVAITRAKNRLYVYELFS